MSDSQGVVSSLTVFNGGISSQALGLPTMLDTTGITIAQKALGGQIVDVRFVRPVLSTILASARIINGREPGVVFSEECEEYAKHSGLADAIAGNYDAMVRPHAGAEGKTWSHLTTLYRHDEIDACNKTINDLLFAQLSMIPRPVVDAIARVIGELHDNVASHSDGRGFSCAQFYSGHGSHEDKLELSVADAGCGFLRNVRRVVSTVTTDSQAVAWCLKKGNTSWRPTKPAIDHHGWADPYAEEAVRSGQKDHHMGLGLWMLGELVRLTRGSLWIWSGNASYTLREDGSEETQVRSTQWPGVLIELAVYPDRARQVDFTRLSARLSKLAEELGL